MSYIYQHKANRDRKYRELKAQGIDCYCASSRRQLLHPMYVQDYNRALTAEEKGEGNTLYKTFFPRLYRIEVLNQKCWADYL